MSFSSAEISRLMDYVTDDFMKIPCWIMFAVLLPGSLVGLGIFLSRLRFTSIWFSSGLVCFFAICGLLWTPIQSNIAEFLKDDTMEFTILLVAALTVVPVYGAVSFTTLIEAKRAEVNEKLLSNLRLFNAIFTPLMIGILFLYLHFVMEVVPNMKYPTNC